MTLLNSTFSRRRFIHAGIGLSALGSYGISTLFQDSDVGFEFIRESLAKHLKISGHQEVLLQFHSSLLNSAERFEGFAEKITALAKPDELEAFVIEEFLVRTNFYEYQSGYEGLSLLAQA